MSKLIWNKTGDRTYETGVEQTVLYPLASDGTYPRGVAWEGVSAITETPSGAEPTPIYADNIKYLTMVSVEELSGTIEAYKSPEEFNACDGSIEIVDGVSAGQQDRTAFGLAYKTLIGNDVAGTGYGYKLHLLYGAMASPSERAYATVNDSPEATPLSWEFDTTPVAINTLVDGKKLKATSILTITSTKVDPAKLAALETILYGADEIPEDTGLGTPAVPAVVARLPLPDEIMTLLA